MKVRKAVIVAAGRGTRFLPLTKSVPKEMLPLVDKPLLQYSVEEALSSGMREIIIITAHGKEAMEDYFSREVDLEAFLEEKGKTGLSVMVKSLAEMADITYVVQEEQRGLGHAVLMAKDAVGDEPFAVLLPDDILDGEKTALGQMLAVYEKFGASVVAVERIKGEAISSYGVIEADAVSPRVFQVKSLVEKPPLKEAPSELGIIGRYILTPRIFEILEQTPEGTGHEIQLTDAMQRLIRHEKMYGCELTGTRYDTGTPLGWLKANVAFALKHEDFGGELERYLRELL